MPDYESEYNNRARVPEHPDIIAGWARDAAAYRSNSSSDLNVRYGPGARQHYDLFRPQEMCADALAVFLHGGYWQALDPGYFSHAARGLNARGVPVAVVGYDLCPAVTLGEIIEQVRTACVALRERFELPLVAFGHSAGGHLAACMLATDWRMRDLPENMVRAGYGISGLYNLKPLTETTVNDALKLSFEESERQSPFFWPTPSGLAFDAVVGEMESAEYHKQSRRLVDVWGLQGAVTRYGEIAGANHFTVIAPLSEPDSAMTARIAELCGAGA